MIDRQGLNVIENCKRWRLVGPVLLLVGRYAEGGLSHVHLDSWGGWRRIEGVEGSFHGMVRGKRGACPSEGIQKDPEIDAEEYEDDTLPEGVLRDQRMKSQ